MEPIDQHFPAELADDLSRILGRDLTSRDFRDRRDGARAPVLGHLATAESRTCRTAGKFLERYTDTGSTAPDPEILWGRDHLDIPTVISEGQVVFAGAAVRPVGESTPEGAVRRLLPTVVALAGAIPSVLTLDPEREKSPRQVPGWLARLGLLVRLDELAEQGAGDLAWLVAAHEVAASVYVPGADKDSLWTVVQKTLTTVVVDALRAADQYPGDPFGQSAGDIAEILDPRRCMVLDSAPEHDGSVLQVIRLPRRDSRRIHRGAVLRAPRRTP